MIYKIEFTVTSIRQLQSLDSESRQRILDYVKDVLSNANNPRELGRALKGSFVGLWRYRVGNYRIICKIYDKELVVCVLKVGHRREIYAK